MADQRKPSEWAMNIADLESRLCDAAVDYYNVWTTGKSADVDIARSVLVRAADNLTLTKLAAQKAGAISG